MAGSTGRAWRSAHVVFVYCLVQFFESFALIYPAYLVLFRREGLSIGSISVLLACATVPVLLLELPSGALADRYGRRTLLIAGLVLKAAGFALWALGDFSAYAAGFVLWGVQEALCSGAQEALLYDALRDRGEQAEYGRIAGYARASSFVATALAFAVGGALAELSPGLTLAATVGSTLIAAAIATLLPEPPQETDGASTSVVNLIKDAVAACGQRVELRRLVLFGALMGATYGLLDEYDQLFVESLGWSLPVIGLLGSARFLVAAAGGALASRVRDLLRLERDARLGAYLAVAGLSLFCAALASPFVALVCYALTYVVLSSGSVLFEQRIQDGIEKSGRATVLSLASLATNLVAMFMALGLGLLSRYGGVRACIGGLAVFGLVSAVLFARRRGIGAAGAEPEAPEAEG